MIFIDFETRSLADLPRVGARNYARHPSTEVLCLAWHFTRAPQVSATAIWSPPWCNPDTYECEIDTLYERVRNGSLVVARNSGFEFHIWNEVLVPKYGAPPLKVEQLLDSAAQVAASNVPRSLGKSALALKLTTQKDTAGAGLIRKLSHGTREDFERTPENLEAMRGMRAYCVQDVRTDIATFKATRPLTKDEWRCFVASERINRRGVCVDVEFAKAAHALAEQEMSAVNQKLRDLTGDPKMSIAAHTRKAKWAHDALEGHYSAQRPILRAPDAKTGKPRYGLDKETVREVLPLVPETLPKVREVLEILQDANSAAVKKYAAILDKAGDDGRLYDMYLFNGAGQTGRLSSYGVQVHNLVRDPLVEPGPGMSKKDAVNLNIVLQDAIVEGNRPAIDSLLRQAGVPLLRALGRLLRPTFKAAPGHVLVWGDWKSIEWIVLPWLSDSSWGRKRLSSFLQGLDPYRLTAAAMFDTQYGQIPKEDPRRQVGKIAELALGYLGGVAALASMAGKFGMSMSEDEAQDHVDAWRRANQGCVAFGDACMAAVDSALAQPKTWFPVARLAYCYLPDFMGGTLMCRLPSGRVLQYPEVRVVERWSERYERMQTDTTYRATDGNRCVRRSLWRGLLIENATQATANCLLRRAIIELEDVAVMHTHDEVIVECPTEEEEAMRERLKTTLEHVPPWAVGLPLAAEIESAPFYFKA